MEASATSSGAHYPPTHQWLIKVTEVNVLAWKVGWLSHLCLVSVSCTFLLKFPELLGSLLEMVVGTHQLSTGNGNWITAVRPDSIWSCWGRASRVKKIKFDALCISKDEAKFWWIKINVLWHLHSIICHKAEFIIRNVLGTKKTKRGLIVGWFHSIVCSMAAGEQCSLEAHLAPLFL